MYSSFWTLLYSTKNATTIWRKCSCNSTFLWTVICKCWCSSPRPYKINFCIKWNYIREISIRSQRSSASERSEGCILNIDNCRVLVNFCGWKCFIFWIHGLLIAIRIISNPRNHISVNHVSAVTKCYIITSLNLCIINNFF